MPSPELLWWSRLPMAILASFSGLLLFTVVCAFASRPAGYIFLVLFAGNSYFLTMLRRAMGESPLLGFLTLATVVGIQAVNSWQRTAIGTPRFWKPYLRPFAWFMIMGIGCGTAGEAKISGLSSILSGIALSTL